MSSEFPKKLALRVDLEEDIAEKFDYIKRTIGIQSNTEVLRYIINRVYRDQKLREKEPLKE